MISSASKQNQFTYRNRERPINKRFSRNIQFSRFCSGSGTTSEVRSDNGTNLLGTKRVLRETWATVVKTCAEIKHQSKKFSGSLYQDTAQPSKGCRLCVRSIYEVLKQANDGHEQLDLRRVLHNVVQNWSFVWKPAKPCRWSSYYTVYFYQPKALQTFSRRWSRQDANNEEMARHPPSPTAILEEISINGKGRKLVSYRRY